MGLLQKACETYDNFEHLAGVCDDESTPLAPVSHIITASQIEITLDQNGNFVSARSVDKKEPKIIIPVTEGSSGRTSAPCPHPLCEQLGYLADYDEKKHSLYTEQLSDWNDSEYSHPKLKPILTYVKNGTILNDLLKYKVIELNSSGAPKNDKAIVRWIVNGLGFENSGPCWKDKSLFDSFINYYSEKQKNEPSELCMIYGKTEVLAKQHPKGIISINGNAKLISSNDSSGFTYRGRFSEDWQSSTVSYSASQKAHNAISWIAANQGIRMSMTGDKLKTFEENEKTLTTYGGRTFLCWNPKGKEIPSAIGISSFLNFGAEAATPSDYKEQLKKALLGWKTKLPENEDVIIAAFDAATTGRLALTYYNELKSSDFLERLNHWDLTCSWKNGKYGIQPPNLYQIVNCAFGVQRDGKLTTDDKILRQQMQRLISCRIDKTPFPYDIERRVVQKTSNLFIYDKSVREQILFCACAVIQKYHYDNDKNKERWNMSTDLQTKDRSFQFGRLLAVLEKTEQDYHFKTSSEAGKDSSGTNAMRMMAVYCQRPWKTYETINKKLQLAYLPRLQPWQRIKYAKYTDEIVGILSEFEPKELNHPLDDTYLLGYHLQRQAMWAKKDTENINENNEEDL